MLVEVSNVTPIKNSTLGNVEEINFYALTVEGQNGQPISKYASIKIVAIN